MHAPPYLRAAQFWATRILLTNILCLLPIATAEDLPLWTRGFTWHRTEGFGPDDRFSLRVVTQEGLHLTGECAYAAFASQTANASPVTIEGTKTAQGIFWPDVISQVKNDRTGKWETVSEPLNRGHRSTITVKPSEFAMELKVSLDVFQPLIGKYKLGRLVLRTGEAAVFELQDLLPPGQDKASNVIPK